MTDSLHILHGDELVGRIDYERKRDAISLHYEDEWRFGAGGFPVSVAKSEVLKIGDMKVLNVERYDRLPDAAGVRVGPPASGGCLPSIGAFTPIASMRVRAGLPHRTSFACFARNHLIFEEDVSRFRDGIGHQLGHLR